jgi:hypothetical protein
VWAAPRLFESESALILVLPRQSRPLYKGRLRRKLSAPDHGGSRNCASRRNAKNVAVKPRLPDGRPTIPCHAPQRVQDWLGTAERQLGMGSHPEVPPVAPVAPAWAGHSLAQQARACAWRVDRCRRAPGRPQPSCAPQAIAYAYRCQTSR